MTGTDVPIAAGVDPFALASYLRDVFTRGILFMDALRERADIMIAHERAGKPPLLDFDYETILDARRFERPANYALLYITRVDEACVADCLDAAKPPVIVIDPRAGHGPGIGGFKRDSEVGIALHEGHAVYFVVFFPEPCPGQTLADVHHALRRFVAEVQRRHPGRPPVLYGNCQAGWAVALLSADCEGVLGPAVLNGSPLSYWASEEDPNVMRSLGGLSGGVWLPHFLADLGDGRFDGAWLVQNFENLKPEKAIFEKYANLFHAIDSERERFLDFERWWNGYYFLGREEITAIVENLFIGNELERGEFRICDGCTVDLTRIRNPLVIFASRGDDITPPYQALGWIPAVYESTEALVAAGQRIVYLINPHVGHLGIFVSAKVARLEHRAILEQLEEITFLPPGLYEMRIDNPTGDPDCRRPQYTVRFEPRRVEELPFRPGGETFERVREVSEINAAFYRHFVSPWVQMAANPFSAALLEWMHPMRSSRYLFSEAFNPWMRGIAMLAEVIGAGREPLSEDHPLMVHEKAAIDTTSELIARGRELRDAACRRTFELIFGSFDSAAAAAKPAAAPGKPRESSPACAPQPEHAACPLPAWRPRPESGAVKHART